MKSLYEKLNINKDTKINKPISYSFYDNPDDVVEGDKVLFACKCGDGDGVLVKCIVNKITYSKFNGQTTNKIFNVGLKLDNDNIAWIKDDHTIIELVENGVSGYKIKTQLLKLE